MTTRPWTPGEDLALRFAYSRETLPTLARMLVRTACAIKTRAAKLGFLRDRFWAVRDLHLVKRLYLTRTAAQISALLDGRHSARSVWQQARKLGIDKWPRWPARILERVRRLHGQGLTDAAIGRRMGLDHRQVCQIRIERLGLPVNAAAILAAKRQAVKTQYARLGIRHGGDLRALAYRKFAMESGWPEDLRPREVQILNVLAAAGVPMTRPEMALAIGMADHERWPSGSRRILLSGNGPGGTYTASLIRRGLVVSLRRGAHVVGQGRGKSRDLYALSPAALAILAARAQTAERA